jgi:hypothetical protein
LRRDDEKLNAIRRAGFEHSQSNFTYDCRVVELLSSFRHTSR